MSHLSCLSAWLSAPEPMLNTPHTHASELSRDLWNSRHLSYSVRSGTVLTVMAQGLFLVALRKRGRHYPKMPKEESPSDKEVSQGYRPKLGVVKCACSHSTHEAEAGRA